MSSAARSPQRALALYGDNARAYNDRVSPELLLCGPAGTGKTLANLSKVLTFAGKYPNTRVLFARKTRASLTESGLVTFERDILGLNNPILTRRPILRKVRQDYALPNGSEIVVAGLDKPDKALSSDYDLIYLLEATDFELADYETLFGRLRTGASPYSQIIADCNPTRPTHWLYRRGQAGKVTLYNSTHRDNPRWWDRKTQEWTEEGKKYVMGRLQSMSGARKKRFYEGVWAAAEGLVYDTYQPGVHNLPHDWAPPTNWPRVWSIDWGFSVPLVVQFWALDPEGRQYLYREHYKTGQRVEVVSKWLKSLLDTCEEQRPTAVICDHDPEAQATFIHHCGIGIGQAWKEDKYEGIEYTQSLFDLQPDGKPQIFFHPNARRHAEDQELSDSGKPTCTVEELAGYAWNEKTGDKVKDEPVKINDHGCDAMRYASIYMQRYRGGTDRHPWATGRPSDAVHGDVRKAKW